MTAIAKVHVELTQRMELEEDPGTNKCGNPSEEACEGAVTSPHPYLTRSHYFPVSESNLPREVVLMEHIGPK